MDAIQIVQMNINAMQELVKAAEELKDTQDLINNYLRNTRGIYISKHRYPRHSFYSITPENQWFVLKSPDQETLGIFGLQPDLLHEETSFARCLVFALAQSEKARAAAE